MNIRTTKTTSRKARSSAQLMKGPSARIEPAQCQAMIAEAAYFRAERRGFEPGYEAEDWYAAEKEIAGVLNRGGGATA